MSTEVLSGHQNQQTLAAIEAMMDDDGMVPEGGGQPAVALEGDLEAGPGEDKGPPEKAPEKAEEGAEKAEAKQDEGEEDEGEGDESEYLELELGTLAGALGIEETDLSLGEDGQVMVQTVVDGERAAVPLAELRKGYQLQRHVDAKAQALNQEREQWQAWAQEQQQALEAQQEVASQILQAEAQQLAEEYKQVPWQQLRVEDPAEWGARRQEFAARFQGLKNKEASIHGAVQQAREQRQQQFNAQRQAYAQEQYKVLRSKITDWSDQAVETADKAMMREFARSIGYTDEEINNTLDHRAILLLRGAARYNQQQAGANPAGKKVRKIRAVMPTGTRKTASTRAKEQRQVQRARLRKTGSLADGAAIVESMLDSGELD